ncbi:Long-chain-fatty-acid--CoA ligase [Rubrivivax sp. A210]|uniref:AMP-binding protein n=1 Tax=Rubrivivax sp. A210 TaxID=2772301 RepID=UPI00191B08FE|nr:AMP-binding protein [Rubrivivax sp. A210]CAD5374481.1 Long-chain-fatty-acid--CoA ligase [Rubrivivax sp. A210]
MTAAKLILDHALDHAAAHGDRIFLSQPVGGGLVVDYRWDEVMDQARRMAAHLQGRGLPRGARVAILSKNCAHFIIAELAIWLAGCTTVAIFPTETAETVRHVLEHSESSLLFVGKLDGWPQQQPGVPAGLPCIALPLAPATAFEAWDAIIARTPPLAGRPTRGADELAMLIYTSGSTGLPKGVMVNFGAFTRAAVGIVADRHERIGTGPSRMLSYLPLAHSFERSWVEGASLVEGGVHLFFAEALDTFVQDLQRARPTLFISVPRLWLKFQQGVYAKMPPAKLDRLLGIPILGRIVARKVLAGLGLDAVVQAGSGSAPIPPALIAWYRRLGLKLFEGYGMTEDNSYSHSSKDGFSEPGWVGVPLPGVEVKLSDEGEILIKSPGRFSGYYKDPELTAASFTTDGFFRTGDLGERRADGMLRLTGRAKELFKTAKGKYVAPAPIENLLNAHPMVELSLVSGVGQPSAYGLVVLAEDLRARRDDAALKARVQAELEQLLKQVNGQLPEHEHLCMLVVARQPWSIDNGLLTPTMKIRRSRIEAAIAPRVEAWYAAGGGVHWE